MPKTCKNTKINNPANILLVFFPIKKWRFKKKNMGHSVWNTLWYGFISGNPISVATPHVIFSGYVIFHQIYLE